MKNKKLAIIGKGTAGSIVLTNYINSFRGEIEIDWYYDPNTPEQAVGEGTTVDFPNFLWSDLGVDLPNLRNTLEGTQKMGIRKINYNGKGDYLHAFNLGNNGVHFNANKFQKHVFEKFKNQVNPIPHNITNPSEIDATHIIDCSGKPKNYDDFNKLDSIPVNSTYIVQCPWDFPKFDYTFTIARPYGWVFIIPLQNRCSVGYLYNNSINNINDIKLDINNIFKKYNLSPSDKVNSFSFNNYYKKENFTDRVSYNGNSSFFLEPIEATSITSIQSITRSSINLLTGNISLKTANHHYTSYLKEVEQMIMLHYFAGSKYDTPFWEYAYNKSLPCIEEMTKNPRFKKVLKEVYYNLNNPNQRKSIESESFGTWGYSSYTQNLINLGLLTKITNLVEKNQLTTNFI